MGDTDRYTTTNLAEMKRDLRHLVDVPISNVHEYSFFQLVEIVRRFELNGGRSLMEELFFSSNPSLGFAASDVSSLTRKGARNWVMETNFLGLSGAQSPLPGFMLEELSTEPEGGSKRTFLDFFNHRAISLVCDIWRKYRYYLRFEPGAQDPVSNQFFALVGLGDSHLRSETPINWCKMLPYSGVLAGRSRSPQVVAGIIAHYFDLEHVTLRQWVKRTVTIEKSQRAVLGKKNVVLGRNSVIGDRAFDFGGKFTVVIRDLNKSRFEDLLPSGQDYLPLCTLVDFILREQLAYDLELHLSRGELDPFQLKQQGCTKLGWSSFLGNTKNEQRILIQVRA